MTEGLAPKIRVRDRLAPLARAVCAVWVSAASGALFACGDTPTATLNVTTGEETDVFSRAPAPVTLLIEGLNAEGVASELARVALPADEISLGDKSRTEVGAVRVTGLDAAGKPIVKGESLFVQFGALEDAPLEVFVQRTGELARVPRGPVALDAPLLGLTVGRFVVGVSGPSVFLYDLLLLRPLASLPTFPRVARSLVTFGTAAILIDDQGATTVDLSTGAATELAAPPGGTFAEVAGGATVVLPDGSAYVVGATRASGGATARVLSITKEGAVAFATLGTPRAGACATWVEGTGLVVVGGSATGPGVEVISPGTAQGGGRAYAPDPVTRCGASTLDGARVFVAGGTGSPVDVGGVAPPRVINLATACSPTCTPEIWPGSVPLVRAESFTLAPDAALVAGDDVTGATHVYRASAAGAREIALKIPRRNARLLALPIKGTAAIVGGGAQAFEQYVE